MSKLVGAYRRFRHNVLYKEGYCKRIVIALITFLVLDLILLYFVW